MRIWRHHLEGDEFGHMAWSLDHLGFATWAPTRDEVLARVPMKFVEYQQWLGRHGLPPSKEERANSLEIVEEIFGDEVAFQEDMLPAAAAEITYCKRLLELTRSDLLSVVAELDDKVMDWDPPYKNFASFASWRTIRQILAHIACTEIGYYLPKIGWQPNLKPKDLRESSWHEQLQLSRKETHRFLDELLAAEDKTRINKSAIPVEAWSVRKVLRRLVWHELLHWKNIRRIVRDYYGQVGSQ
ncbi:MAG TPA: DinB family protein [Firmicutes bacterium]|nr:DinB family protein [Bacillota bacterium]